MEDKQEIKPKYISFSEYSLFRNCPHKWYHRYVLKETEPSNEFLVFGSALHATIEHIVKQSPSKILYGKLFENQIKENSNGVVASSYFGRNMVREGVDLLVELDYFKRFSMWEPLKDEAGNIISLEEQLFEPLVEYKGEMIYFKGFIDYSARHKVNKDKYIILDWKTGIKEWNLDKKVGVLTFESYYPKLVAGEPLTTEEQQDLTAKLFFGQTVLYQQFYAQKHNLNPKDIIIGYCVLTRQPVNIQEYSVEQQDTFTEFVMSDVRKAAVEIMDIKSNTDVNKLDQIKAKDNPGLKGLCQYCHLKKDKC